MKITHILTFATFVGGAWCLNAAVSVDGTIVDEAKRPVLNSQVRVYDGDKLLTPVAQPTTLQGRYHIDLPDFTGDHLMLQIDAKGFSSARITVVVSRGKIDVEPIVLKKKPGLVGGALQISTSPNQNLKILESVVRNDADVPVEIREVHLLGSTQSKIDCADYSPGVISTISKSGDRLAVRISVPEEHWNEEKAISGRFESLPCGISRLHLSFDVSWSVAPKKRQKLRIEIPIRMVVRAGSMNKTVSLNTFQFLIMRLVDEEQQANDFKSF
jgi:hypothetical protein